MLFAMMRPAERDREFIADLLPKPARLGKAQMVRVAGIAAADKAGLLRYKSGDAACPQPLGSGRARERRCSIVFVGRYVSAKLRPFRP
jgi:hypothetical protein